MADALRRQPARPDLRPRRYYHGWNIVTVCVVAQVAALALTVNCFSLFIGGWTAEFDAPVSTIVLSITLFSVGCAIVAPFVGTLADRVPARKLFAAAMAGLALFHFTLAATTAAWQVVTLYALVLPAIVSSGSSIPSQALVSRWFVRRAGLAMGLTAFGLALSGVVFPPVIAALLPIIGWRGVWIGFGAAIVLLAIPLMWFVLHDRPAIDDRFDYVTAPAASAASAAAPALRSLDILRRPNFWAIVGAFMPVQFVSMVMYIDLAPIVEARGLDAATVGWLLSLMSFSALVAKLGVGLLADRYGDRLPLLLVTVAASTGALLIALGGVSLPVLGASMILVGISGGIWTLVASATAKEFGAAGFGRAFGLVCATAPVGSLGPPIVVYVQEHGGGYTAGLVGTAALALVGVVAASLLRQARPAAR